MGVVTDSEKATAVASLWTKINSGWWQAGPGERYAGMAEPETVAMEMGA